MSSRHNDTYIMFSKKGKGFGKVIGPFFSGVTDKLKKTHFPNNKIIHIVEETAFASRYPKKYDEHIRGAWLDKLYTYFQLNYVWCNSVRLSLKDRCCTGDWFGLFEMKDDDIGTYFQINISVNANRFYEARLRQDLQDMDIFPIVLGDEYYQDRKNNYYTDRVVSRFLADELIDNCCLS